MQVDFNIRSAIELEAHGQPAILSIAQIDDVSALYGKSLGISHGGLLFRLPCHARAGETLPHMGEDNRLPGLMPLADGVAKLAPEHVGEEHFR